MAGFGAKHPCFALMATEPVNSDPTYNAGIVLGRLVAADFTATLASGELWADNIKAESVDEFASGTIAMQTDALTDTVAQTIYGATVNGGVVEYRKDDQIPYGGLGYYKVLKRNNVTFYKAYFYPKARAQIGSDSAQTKAASITFTTENITWTIDVPYYAPWREVETFADEAAAIAWVESKCNVATWYNINIAASGTGIVTPVGTTAVAAGEDLTITLGAAPDAIYDNGADVSASLTQDHEYVLTSIAADHDIVIAF